MKISDEILRKRDKDAFNGGFESALEPMTNDEERSVEHTYGKYGVSAVRAFLAYRRGKESK